MTTFEFLLRKSAHDAKSLLVPLNFQFSHASQIHRQFFKEAFVGARNLTFLVIFGLHIQSVFANVVGHFTKGTLIN